MAAEEAAGVSLAEKAPMCAPLMLPIEAPTPTSVPHERAVLSQAQQAKYDWLLQDVQSWTTIAGKEDTGSGGSDSGGLTDDERLWLTRECLLRYLRATKWHEKEAARRLQGTLSWRRDYGVEAKLTADYISPENETGKQIILGYDREGRVCQYLNPGRQNTDASPRQVQHLVYMVERVIDLLPPGQETLALLINFKQSKSRSNTAPGIAIGREVLHILQTHYPERLGRALIINVPWVVWGFFKLITPFIDPLTREKLKFNEDMNQYVPPEQLWTEFNGQLRFHYDHAVYWPALTKLAADRRRARKARWVAAGKHIGESEDYLAGKLEHGVFHGQQELANGTAEATPGAVANTPNGSTEAAAPAGSAAAAAPAAPAAAPETATDAVDAPAAEYPAKENDASAKAEAAVAATGKEETS